LKQLIKQVRQEYTFSEVMRIKELHFHAIQGLFREFFEPSLKELKIKSLDLNTNSLIHANGLFWNKLLSRKKIRSAIELLADKYKDIPCDKIYYAAILEKPDLFIKFIESIPEKIANHATDEQSFFNCIETLSILCKLYSDTLFSPHELTVQDGFFIDETSSLTLLKTGLTKENPYFDFLVSECFPVIAANPAEIAWIHGPIRISTFAMAMKAKELYPEIKIFVTRHSSEYYSLNKITDFLKLNTTLFSVIDGIILVDYADTEQAVKNALSNEESLKTVNNLLYFDNIEGCIVQTEYAKSFYMSFEENLEIRPSSFPEDRTGVIDPSELVSGKLFPEKICPWRKCTFCGINKKYPFSEGCLQGDPLDHKIDVIENLVHQGKKYFWFYDEALTADELIEFSKKIIARRLEIIYHVRTRFDIVCDRNTCHLLAQSGLREIRIGLESASYDVLKAMNKYDMNSYSLEQISDVIAMLSEAGISVHCPTIIGFPGSNKEHIEETFNFISSQMEKHPNFSFNVNILQLDVASELFHSPEKFGLSSVALPTDPKYFLGNIVFHSIDESNTNHTNYLLYVQREIMREFLYPWMPISALTPPHIFYRLVESARNTLFYRSISASKKREFKTNGFKKLTLSPYAFLFESVFLSCSKKNGKISVKCIDSIVGTWYNFSSPTLELSTKHKALACKVLGKFHNGTRLVSEVVQELCSGDSSLSEKVIMANINQLICLSFLKEES